MKMEVPGGDFLKRRAAGARLREYDINRSRIHVRLYSRGAPSSPPIPWGIGLGFAVSGSSAGDSGFPGSSTRGFGVSGLFWAFVADLLKL